jgi:hypothetical protein
LILVCQKGWQIGERQLKGESYSFIIQKAHFFGIRRHENKRPFSLSITDGTTAPQSFKHPFIPFAQ